MGAIWTICSVSEFGRTKTFIMLEHDRTFLISNDFLLIINLLVAGGGFLLFFLLISMPKGRRLSNALLAAFVLVIAVVMLLWYFLYRGIVTHTDPVYLVWSLLFLQGPLLYFYVLTLINPRVSWRWLQAVHLLPCLLAVFYLQCHNNSEPHLALCGLLVFVISDYYEVIQVGLFIVYLLNCLYCLRQYESGIRRQYSALEALTLSWLYRIILVNLCVQLIYGLVKLGVIISGDFMRVGWVRHIGEALLVFLIGLASLRHRILFSDIAVDRQEFTPDIKTNVVIPKAKYQRSSLTKEQVRELSDKLRCFMEEEEPFLNGEIKLLELAALLGLSANVLSQVINEHSGQSFYDFINRYRAYKAKELIEDKAYANDALINLAADAGFNSKNTFYKYFKKHFLITPAEYRKQFERSL